MAPNTQGKTLKEIETERYGDIAVPGTEANQSES